MKIKSKWKDFIYSINACNSERCFKELNELYSESHRHYHDWNHIEYCLDKLEEYYNNNDLLWEDKLMIEAGIWYHDCIYEIGSKFNEENSAHFFAIHCNRFSPNVRMKQEVYRMIEGSNNHFGRTKKEQIMYDIDLSSLGDSPEIFKTNADNIRKEYSIVPDNIFYPKRAEILESFLSREKIFQTKHFSSLEEQARKNIQKSIKECNAIYN